MKQLRWPVTSEDASYLAEIQRKNQTKCKFNSNENWAESYLTSTGYKWSRQALWGYRLYDFWSHELGCAVEIDGPEHDKDYDSYRDEYNFRRSGIVVLRVRNLNEMDMENALRLIKLVGSWKDRRAALNIQGNKKQKRALSSQAFEHSMLQEHLTKLTT